MTVKTAKIQGGSLRFPDKLPKTWRSADVFVNVGEDTIVIKKAQLSLASLRPALKELGKKISKSDIESSIQALR